jgi:hypothetical protein
MSHPKPRRPLNGVSRRDTLESKQPCLGQLDPFVWPPSLLDAQHVSVEVRVDAGVQNSPVRAGEEKKEWLLRS